MSTKALPVHFYQDPAKVLENLERMAMTCRDCESGFIMAGNVACVDERNPRQKGVPRIGARCKFFKERN